MLYVLCLITWWILLAWIFRKVIWIKGKRLPLNQLGKTIKFKVERNDRERMRTIKGESDGLLKKLLLLWEKEIGKNNNWTFSRFVVMSLAMSIGGIATGLYLKNIGVGVVLGVGCGMLPYYLLRHQNLKYETCKQEQLLIVLANIQSEYTKPGTSFVVAVKNALPSIPSHLYDDFKTFCDTLLLLNPDSPHQAYKDLERRVGHYFFTEYLSLARMVEEGESGLKATMAAIPEAYQQYLDYNRFYRNQVTALNDQFLMTFLAFPMILSFLKGISTDYYTLLVETGIGKFTLCVITFAFVSAGILFGRYNQPIEFEI